MVERWRTMTTSPSTICASLSITLFSDQEKRLRIIATDITRRKALELPKDLADYSRIESGPLSWKSGEPFSVALAVRMSMAIPAIFEPA
jgi:predicted acylesterase/phospholipase RssA